MDAGQACLRRPEIEDLRLAIGVSFLWSRKDFPRVRESERMVGFQSGEDVADVELLDNGGKIEMERETKAKRERPSGEAMTEDNTRLPHLSPGGGRGGADSAQRL